MQQPSAYNRRFLEKYGGVLTHHVECILASMLILDEDMHLVTTFCEAGFVQPKAKSSLGLVSVSSCTAVGFFLALRLRRLYPLAVSALPGAIQILCITKDYYYERKYRRNFERLVGLLQQLYKITHDILEHNQKREGAIQNFKVSNEARNLLSKPGEEFLKFASMELFGVLEQIKSSIMRISMAVPLMEGDFIYSARWNLDELRDVDDTQLNHHYQKLTDLYILMVSNFFSCVALSFCPQLWLNGSCKFKSIFDDILPSLLKYMELSVCKVKKRFDSMRFTLCARDDTPKRRVGERSVSAAFTRLYQPLADFLTNLQFAFELAKQLQLLLEQSDPSCDMKAISDVFESLDNQFTVCDDTLECVYKMHTLLVNRSPARVQAALSVPVTSQSTSVANICYDDASEQLEDEEYNLSIQGSEDGDVVPLIYDYADQCSTEHLELMLQELKRKLQERRGGPDPAVACPEPRRNQVIEGDSNLVDRGEAAVPLPPPPPPPVPVAGESSGASATHSSHRDFLDAVRAVAQKLNRDEEFQFGFNMFPDIPRPFNTTYRCFSVAMLPGNERQDVERGGKIIMPPSALEQLTRLNINYPMLFKIVNKKTNRTTHCGVLEFVADEGKVYLPLWMMHNLVLEEGDLIQIESVSLPVGTFAKFQPLSSEFLDITNPKAVLENCLRTFACLTSEDVIAVKYNQRVYELCVLETKPGNAISIIECDMNVEFAPPVGYREADEVKQPEEDMVVDPADLMPEPSGFVAFRGTGNRLDGKRRKDSGSSECSPPKPVYVRGIPDYDYQIGTLRFLRHITKSPISSKEENGEFKAFSGEGFSLKQRN